VEAGNSAGETIGSLGEFGLIRALAARMPAGPATSLGIGDDSAVVGTPSGSVVAAVDMVIEGRHFRREWSSGTDVGVKAAARSLADIAAMGAKPTALLVALAAPGSLPAAWALELADGLAQEASRAGAGIVGGDTASAQSVVLSVTALGDLAGLSPVLRSGARPGDMVAVAGTLGRSAAGLALLTAGAGLTAGGADGGPLVEAHLRPAPPYEAGPEAARLGATAMIDVSDGLLADLGHVARASAVTIGISSGRLAPFADDALEKAAKTLGSRTPSAGSASGGSGGAGVSPGKAQWVNPEGVAAPGEQGSFSPLPWILTGGEDHALVATFPPHAELPAHWRVIGEVRAPGAGSPPNVTVDGRSRDSEGGWEHFR
jgi:thiamine-monophosphate kinase